MLTPERVKLDPSNVEAILKIERPKDVAAVRRLSQVSHDHRSFERNLSNCEQKPEKVRTSVDIRSSIYETFHISLQLEDC